MSIAAADILSAYSFIFSLSLEQLLEVGNQSKNGHPIPSFNEDILISLCEDAKKIFKNEENVLKIEGDLIVVGGIHGSLHDLLRIIKYVDKKNSKVLFLGDYVDRGNFSLECITLLLAMKISRPESIYLIRGNHEFDTLCSKYGFKDELIDRFQYTSKLYDSFLSVFSYLPLCSLVNNSTFCVHGGLSPLLNSPSSLNNVRRPLNLFEECTLATDVVWSDPSSASSVTFGQSSRGMGYVFNEESVHNFLKANTLRRIIRGHQCVKNGVREHFNKRCITVFSASSYSVDMGNHSGILRIVQSDDTVEYMMFPPLHRLEKSDTWYRKVGRKKTNFFSMKHPKPVFRGSTIQKVGKGEVKGLIEKRRGIMRDFNVLKINCHVNPALIANYRKSAFPFVHIPPNGVHHKAINKSVSLPTKLLIYKDDGVNESWGIDNQHERNEC